MHVHLSETEALVNKLASPWGGEWQGVKLTNTCPMDTILSALFIQYSLNGSFKCQLNQLGASDSVCEVLIKMFDNIDGHSHSWTAARLQWIQKILKKPIRVCVFM